MTETLQDQNSSRTRRLSTGTTTSRKMSLSTVTPYAANGRLSNAVPANASKNQVQVGQAPSSWRTLSNATLSPPQLPANSHEIKAPATPSPATKRRSVSRAVPDQSSSQVDDGGLENVDSNSRSKNMPGSPRNHISPNHSGNISIPKSAAKKGASPQTSRRQLSRQSSMASATGGFPGVPWSPQGKLSGRSVALLADHPASLAKKFSENLSFEGNSFQLSWDGDGQTSMMDGDDLTYDMLTDANEGTVDEDVRSAFFSVFVIQSAKFYKYA